MIVRIVPIVPVVLNNVLQCSWVPQRTARKGDRDDYMETSDRPNRPCRLFKRLGRSGRSGRSYGNQALIISFMYATNGPFALTGHMVQNPPYWMAKECSRFEHKGIPTCQAQLSFVFDVPVEDATFFCHPVWRILYHVTS